MLPSFSNSTDQNSITPEDKFLKWVLLVSNINFVLTPLAWNYLAEHDFQPQWLNELFGLLLVAFIIGFIFWAASIFWEIRKFLWILPIAIICAVFSLWLVVKPVECVFQANLPKFTHKELRHQRGWPFSEYACNDKPADNIFGTIINSLYWSSMILGVSEAAKKFNRRNA